VRAAVIVFPGSNREGDVARALEQANGRKPDFVWHADHELPKGTDLVVLPGGFSYGDYLRCGAIAGRAPIMAAVRSHAEKGGLVLGICNGFQILCESGLLPGVLMRNRNLRFVCHMQHLRVERAGTAFTGQYRSPELDATYAVSLKQGVLTLQIGSNPSMELVPIANDEFDVADFFTVVFDRAKGQHTSGFTLFANAASNVHFVKVN